MTDPLKYSIVTPTYNSEKYIGETIESVISQGGNFSIEYIIQDGGSTDRTYEIVRGYQQMLSENSFSIRCAGVVIHWRSEEDDGMYDAIQNGFAHASGDVYAWINSDDLYLPGALDVVQRTLERYPEILWLKGITSYINEGSTIYAVGNCNLYRQDWIESGIYGPVLQFIQQDSVFWRAVIWQKSGGVDTRLSLAGDYFLWKSFAKLAPLYSLQAYVSCFRKVADQKSANIDAYFQEIEKYSPLDKRLSGRISRNFVRIESLPRILRPFCYKLVFGMYSHHLVVLHNSVVPCLIEDEYFALRDKI